MSDEAIKKLKRQRGSVKAKLTIFSKYINELCVNINTENVINADDFHQLETRLTLCGKLIDEFSEIQAEIEEVVSDADLEAEYKEREAFSNEYFHEINTESVAARDSVFHTNVKLPPIQVPKFSGDYETWLEFRETFESLIHTNESLTGIQKFHYLKVSLAGNAAEVVSSLEFSANNYAVAWDLLCDRYNNSRLLVQNHIKVIFNIQAFSKESSKTLRNIIDTLSKHLKALKQLNQPAEHWDTLIIYIVTSKLDTGTIRDWEEYISKLDVPKLSDLKSFLKSKADLLETIELKGSDTRYKSNKINSSKVLLNNDTDENINSQVLVSNTHANAHDSNDNKIICVFCKRENHFIRNCADFLKLSPTDRVEQVKRLRLCLNCLRFGHKNTECRLSNCRKCNGRHNTLIHISIRNNTQNNTGTSTTLSSYNLGSVLLSTALIQVEDQNNKTYIVRAILDSGSQSNFISMDLCKRLKLKTSETVMSVAGINNAISEVNKKCELKINSQHSPFNAIITCFVIKHISGLMPSTPVDIKSLKLPDNILLADASFDKPGPVDILIGASLFWELLQIGPFKLGSNLPVLQKTVFGWIVSGTIGLQNQNNKIYCNLAKNIDVQTQLTKFWELEEFGVQKHWSREEELCEQHFKATTTRDPTGRFIVSIPLKDSLEKLGESKTQAEKRFLALERKMARNPDFKNEYVKFMREYEALGHMRKISGVNEPLISYFMPHHGVFKQDSLTTRLRVVFDCSAPTTTGVSMNNLQMVGPTIQSDLLSILLRFRTYTFVIAADIAKMYRQILVKPDQRSLQRIIWRENSSDPLNTYELLTVTYGTSSAAFLAVRCLAQLAIECENDYPLCSDIIKNDFYVDDALFGADSVEQLSEISIQISKILRSGGFDLRKWHSNSQEVVQNVTSDTKSNISVIKIGTDETTKTLGLAWSNANDVLTYDIGLISKTGRVTKRVILSCIGQIFDPLGLLSPCVITVKILLQKLWLEKLAWDEAVSCSIHSTWLKFRDEINSLNDIRIIRHAICNNPKFIEMHCFSDASQDAYGSCIYVRSRDQDGNIQVHLFCAKTKVAPLKVITIPRLELCGALLSARLAKKIMSSLKRTVDNIIFWTDSSIVLGWLKTSPSHLKTFVANRISEIQETTGNWTWRHVSTKHNPADILSRGVSPSELLDHSLWWHGPEWLAQHEHRWPISNIDLVDLPELKSQALKTYKLTLLIDANRFSSLIRLKRSCAYVFRFIQNCKRVDRMTGMLTVVELHNSYSFLLKLSQLETFSDEINLLSEGHNINHNSKLFNLNPFIDANGLLRVGGRLENSAFHQDKKHPIIISAKTQLCKLIFKHEHVKMLHAGPQHLLSNIREHLWPIGGRNLAKHTVRSCVTCFRFKPTYITPLMGNLPQKRLEMNYPFQVCGVDYAGPFSIKDRKGRGAKTSKCYLALFVCFSTKAVHLELVSDLTTNSFICSLKRFISRRGKPVRIYSDNGTNLVGAYAELRQLQDFFNNNKTAISDNCSNDGIEWRFIPVNSPHFGGLWEAGVKSSKSHLKRVIGNTILTFEELCTVFAQIEAVLNSRPISPLTCDPNDLNPLTPAHFLIGRTLLSPPEADLMAVPVGRLNRYQLLEQMRQNFWSRWSKEYVSELQQRMKWRETCSEASIGSIVLIKEDNQPPLRWKMGRITALHPGKDGISRVVTIQTANGTIKRACRKICPLPLLSEETC
ncbi:uncharacterized protein LOC115886162 [Sitophilus oryzae]|uniref:Uncharacterized protein LOC115886162 n=1 Tax=Sitophilus oryzae TaxID=7048 RepID=A0A6J2YDY2_SITOR|nr:uncharacterized protein LOC115886162 [Sitophilus oryzae]